MNIKRSALFMNLLIVASSLLLFSSCASILSQSSYPVYVNSNPSNASLSVRNSEGEIVFQGETPATVKLDASEGFFAPASYSFEITLAGYTTKIRTVNATIDPYYFLNLLGPNVLGLLVIDPLTGAMWQLRSDYIIEELDAQTAANEEEVFKIMLLEDIPQELRAEMIPLPHNHSE